MKTKITALFSSLLFIISISSCTTFLTPAILGNNMGYMPKAMGADSVKTLTTLSGSYAASISPDANVGFEFGMANISRSHTFEKANISYGIFGYAGVAKGGNDATVVDNSDNYLPSFKKSIGGIGFRLSTGLHHTSANGNTDFRFVNFENAVSFEGGSYTAFRKQIFNGKIPDHVGVTDRKVIWTTGLSTEVIWRARKEHEIKHAFRFFIGGTPDLVKSFRSGSEAAIDIRDKNSLGWAFNYFLYVKRFSLSFELANSVNYSEKLSLGYSFR
ncbi:hypothetical protein ASE74_09195 [Pedobacter sp. Leaf216]|uniref:hypothetical protein n=1 Tax=Pedobacter sp. Leaf216 TaxID=1735684 RepID=UPI0007016D7E|nr:hypothetical protein [Pedobacter sp. Leaf216]KQM66055.1 hypothetical protein ASE74_09195 [Pedobacter sp. Leaf216]